MRNGTSGQQRVIDLGDAERIDSLVTEWAMVVASTAPDRPPALRACVKTAAALRRAIWDPLATQLRRALRVFLVPDHRLSRVVWETLPVGRWRYPLDSPFKLIRLFSERDLVLAPTDWTGGGLLAVGRVDYDNRDERLAVVRTEAAARGARRLPGLR